MHFVSGEQGEGISCNNFFTLWCIRLKNNSVMAKYRLALIAQAKRKNVAIKLLIRESEIIVQTV
jgi:hypothetical protein